MAIKCKQISLRLVQGNLHCAAYLMGDILQDDCLVIACDEAPEAGSPAILDVCFQQQTFQVSGDIEHCRQDAGQCVVHFRIDRPDQLQTRMLLQLSEIEQYRQYLVTKGRDLTIDQAADEWVKRYAEDFASEFDAEHRI